MGQRFLPFLKAWDFFLRMVESWECLVWFLEPKTTIEIKKPKKSYYSYYSLATFLILFHPSNLDKKSSKIYLTLVWLLGSLRINGRIYPWLELQVLILIFLVWRRKPNGEKWERRSVYFLVASWNDASGSLWYLILIDIL